LALELLHQSSYHDLEKPMYQQRILFLALLAASVPAFASSLLVGAGEDGDTTSEDIVVPTGISAGAMDSTSGDVRLETGATATSADTTSGDVELGFGARILGKIDVTSGDVTLGINASAGSIDTTSGSIRLGGGASSKGIDSTSGSVDLAPGAVVRGKIDTTSGIVVGQGAQIFGAIDTTSGDISLTTSRVSGNVLTYSGRVHILTRSHVSGNVVLRKPNCDWNLFGNCSARETTVIIGAGSIISGNIIAERPIRLYVHPTAQVNGVIGSNITKLTDAQAISENPAAAVAGAPLTAERQ
jgi:cytoskeletal protein CcmA (bactofilin family)